MDIMFGEEDVCYKKPKPKRKVKKSKHKHNYVWAIGKTESERYPEILINYCEKCGKVDNIRIPYVNETILDFAEWKLAKARKVIVPYSDKKLFFDVKYI